MTTKKVVFNPKYVQAVNDGVKWLDHTFGSRNAWLKKMNMSRFQIQDSNTCVAGNVFQDAMFNGHQDGYNSFVSMVDAIGGEKSGKSAAYRFGFLAKSRGGMQQLQDLWVMKINGLKKAKPAAKKKA